MSAGQDVGGFGVFIANGSSTGCLSGCEVQQKSGGYDIVKGGTYAPGTYTGWACKTSAAITPDTSVPDSPKLDDTKKHPPNCAAGEGVLTSSSGKVSCVPPGTPNASTPDIQKKTQTEKFPDNTTKITETTTTTDPNTNAKETVTTTTSTGGSSGSPGTTTTTTSNSGNVESGGNDGSCTGDECTDNAKKGAFGDYGTLWEKKYPDGLEKVIKDKVAEMKNTPLFRLAGDLAPQGIGNSGTCPAWTFNANIGPKMNFGSGSYAPPCWLWTALRAVFLITALLMARRLIFGG